jgi:hypothetical protein
MNQDLRLRAVELLLKSLTSVPTLTLLTDNAVHSKG